MKQLLLPALTVLAGALTFSACKKSETAAVSISGTYVSNNLYSVDAPRMYYLGGSSTDTALIGGFIRRNLNFGSGPGPDQYIQLSGLAAPVTNPVTLTINGNTATLQSGATTFGLDVLTQDASGLLLARRDSSVYYPQNSPCERLWRGMMRNRPDSAYFYYPTSGNMTGIAARYRPYYPVDIENGRWYLPLLGVAMRAGMGCVTASSGVPARFDAGVTGQLVAGDTLVVQRKRVELLRQ